MLARVAARVSEVPSHGGYADIADALAEQTVDLFDGYYREGRGGGLSEYGEWLVL